MMQNTSLKFIVLFTLAFLPSILFSQTWRGNWIATNLPIEDSVNVWLAFKKDIDFKNRPEKLIARIAADSKYWLYVNGHLIIFEGGLKRGPNPEDTYYDEVDLAPFVKQGKNDISVLLWYFGKNGFSHNSSGQPGLCIDIQSEDNAIFTDGSWRVKRLKEYQTAPNPIPNFRLPESNILYDARLADGEWYKKNVDSSYDYAVVKGRNGDFPWGNLVKRPIPQWKDFGLKYFKETDVHRKGDTIICKLPYNMQFTPFFEIEGNDGEVVKLLTDNYLYYNGSSENIRAEYITRLGRQSYESLGWLNGHFMYFIVPSSVKIHKLGYRETGFNTEFVGYFECSDHFFNTLWEKARRTLYITMRDTYMDCPDRERAQWTGDAVLEAEEAFYALDTNAHSLAKKWLYELIGWQKPDGVLFSPIPAGNWHRELPDQVLASIGYYGIWTYYKHTGDKKILEDLFPAIQRYMSLWEKDETNLVKLRKGGWQWGDWGDNKDMLLLYNLWYYLSMKGSYLMAKELGYNSDVSQIALNMEDFKHAFNKKFWRNNMYRDPLYTGKTDDRVHALAVLSGIADSSKYDNILKVFHEQEHASPYMEKYVYEAMYEMGRPVEANSRHKKRFSAMVNNSYFTTLFEGWGIGSDGFGGGTVNHAWSGGGLTILSSKLCGISPLTPGYSTFLVKPQIGDMQFAKARVPSIKGNIDIAIENKDRKQIFNLVVPMGTQAFVEMPLHSYQNMRIGKDPFVIEGRVNMLLFDKYNFDKTTQRFVLSPGEWTILAEL